MNSLNRIVLSFKILRYKLNYLLLRGFHRTTIKGHLCVRNVRISDKGKNNKILAGKNVILKNCKFFFQGNNHVVLIGDGIRISGVTFAFEKEGSCIELGRGVWIGPGCCLSAMAHTKIYIGICTLLARDCIVRTSDSHVVMDENGNVINTPQDIMIGNHAWLGEQVFVLKGAHIADNCIVGARSVVTASTKTEASSIIVGQPAKIIKKNVSWKL